MAWKKVKTKFGIHYEISDSKYIYQYVDNITLDELNDDDRGFSFTHCPTICYEKQPLDSPPLDSGCYSYETMGYGDSRLVPFIPTRDRDLFKLSVVDGLLDDFNTFRSTKDLYDKIGLVYKRGCLLFGPPGTGKTCAVRVLLDTLKDQDVLVIWIKKNIDIDTILEFRKETRLKIFIFEELLNSVSNQSIEWLLSFLDGENSLDNTYVIATTNYPEKLPAALTDRPGRFDKLFKVDYLSEEDRRKYLSHFLARKITNEELEHTKNLPISSIKEMLLMMIKDNMNIEEVHNKILDHQRLVKNEFKSNKDKTVGFLRDDT